MERKLRAGCTIACALAIPFCWLTINQAGLANELKAERKGEIMVADQKARAEITNYGAVKRLQSPPGWTLKTEDPAGISSRSCKLFHPPDEQSVNINVFYRGMPINESSTKIMQDVLQRKPAEKGPQILSEDEIKELSHVFGINTVGDNQYTNDAAKGKYDYHVFHMSGAETVKLQGKTTLHVTGTFQDENGNATTEYNGYLFHNPTMPENVEEIFFQAPTKELYDQYLAGFEESLKSLQWR